MCCWSAFNRAEGVVLDMCILLTLNAAYCPLEHMEVICVKFTEMGVIWLFFPHGFVYMQIVKKVAGQQGLSF